MFVYVYVTAQKQQLQVSLHYRVQMGAGACSTHTRMLATTRGGNTTVQFTLLYLNCYKDSVLHCIV